MLFLSPRLAAAAGLLDGGKTVADVGTDHAYIPAYLIQSGKCTHVIASDIGGKPLENARQTLRKYGLEEQIELRISDGLCAYSPEEAEEICICGMGGTLIAEILAAAPWILRPGMHLVLQPMTHSEDVRAFLCGHGFLLRREVCVSEGGRHVYCCISADWVGQTEPVPAGFSYFGTLLRQEDAAAKAFVKKQYLRVKKRADALRGAGIHPEEEAMLREVIDYYVANGGEA